MSTAGRWGFGLVLVAGLTGAGYWGWTEYQARQVPRADLRLHGNVDVRQVILAFRVPGKIETIAVEEGDRVAAGDIVGTLEKADYSDQLTLARAKVDASAAVLSMLEDGSRPEDIERAKAAVAQAEAALELARTIRDRQAVLAGRDIASHQAHEAAQAGFDEAAAALRQAEAMLALALEGPRSGDISQARAALAADRATLSIAQRRVADTELHAPSDGVILTRVREPGSIVASGEPILTLALTSPVWVRTYVNEPDLGRIAPGMVAEIHTDSGGRYRGQIGFISPVAEFTPKSVETEELRTSLVYRLRVIVEVPDDGLRQGMPVTVVLTPEGES